MNNLEIQGHPEQSLIITLISSPNIVIEPKIIHLTKNKTSAMFTITAKRYGSLFVKYEITGENEADFDNPDHSFGFVDDINKASITPICYQCGGTLKKGCFIEMVKNIALLSYLPWSPSKVTRGITQVMGHENNTLPLSLIGGVISSFSSFAASNVGKTNKTGNFASFSTNCTNKGEEPINIGTILRTHAFEYSVQVFFNTFSPSWFKLLAALKVHEYSAKDLVGELYKGFELQSKSLPCIAGFRFKINNTYYMHQTSQIYNILLPQNLIELPDFITKCLIMDLNKKHIYFGFSENNYITATSAKLFESITNNFSSAISSWTGFRIVSSKISFEIISSKHKLNVVGRQQYRLGLMNLNVALTFEGKMAYNYDEALERYGEVALSEKGVVDISVTFYVDGKAKLIKLNGLCSEENSCKIVKSNNTANVLAKIFPVTKILQSNSSSKVFTLSELSPVALNVTSNLFKQSLPSETKKKGFPQPLIKCKKEVNKTVNFLKRLFLDNSLRDNLETLKNAAGLLLNKLSLYESNDNTIYGDIVSIRLLFSQVLKKFSVLLDQYLQTDKTDGVRVTLTFMNFKKAYDEFIAKTHANSSEQYRPGELSHGTIKGKGKFCTEYFCFKDIALTIDLNENMIIGQFIKKENIGNYLKIYPLSNIYHYQNKSVTMKGEAVVFNQVKKVNITIRSSILSFNVDVKIGSIDSVPLTVTSSLDAIIRGDPLYFVFTGNAENSNKLMIDIKDALNDHFTELEKRLNSRERSIRSSQSSAKRLFDVANDSAVHVSLIFQQLKKELKDIDANLTITETLLKKNRETYNLAVKQNANITLSQIQMLADQCQPKLCNLSCLPGLKRVFCRRQRQVHLINQNCLLQNISTILYQHVQVNKTVSTINYVKKEYCWSECPIFKKLWDKNGKRKQQNVSASNISALVKTVLTELRTEIEGSLLSTSGIILGGFISNIFGVCDQYCAFDYMPVPGYITLKEYEKRPVIKETQKGKCENKVGYISGSTKIVYECDVLTPCKSILIDKNCTKKQLECIQLRKSITDSTLHKSRIEKIFQKLAKTAFVYELLITRRDMLSLQFLNIKEKLEIALNLNGSAYRSYLSFQKNLKAFQYDARNDRLMIDKYKKQPKLFKSAGLKMNFSYTSRMKFPEQFLIEINVRGLSSTSLFDVNNYKKSVHDISLKIKDLVEETVTKKREKRSIKNAKPNTIDKKCMSIQQAEMFLLEVLKTYRDRLISFAKLKFVESEQIKKHEEQLTILKQDISNQFASDVDNSTKKALNAEFDETCARNLKIEREIYLTNSWNSTLIEIFFDLQSLTDDLNQTKCVNFLDCLQFYLDILKDIILMEGNSVPEAVTEAMQHLRVDMFHLVTGYLDINHSEKLITKGLNSLFEINPTEWFCGNPPSIKIPLKDTIHIKEGEILTLKVEVLNIKHSFEITWKHNNFILSGYNTNVLNKTVSKKDEGYFSCEISNRFGRSNCGTTYVKIVEKIKFLIEPQDITGYLHSPQKIYLICAVKGNTSNGAFTWLFRRFTDPESKRDLLPVSKPRIEIKQDTVNTSGFYSCQYSNKLTSAVSREAIVHVLNTNVAVERVRVTMLLSNIMMSGTGIKDKNDKTRIKSELAKIMLTESSQIEISDLFNGSRRKNKVEFVLSGRHLINDHEKYAWSDLTKKIIKERENLLLRSVLLYRHANNTKNFSLTLNGNKYSIYGDSITIEPLDPSCLQSQALLKNGFICGKHNRFQTPVKHQKWSVL